MHIRFRFSVAAVNFVDIFSIGLVTKCVFTFKFLLSNKVKCSTSLIKSMFEKISSKYKNIVLSLSLKSKMRF